MPDAPTHGFAALASVARFHGLPVDLAGARTLSGLGQKPLDGVLLLYAARQLGLDATPLEGEFHQLPEVDLPTIVTFGDAEYHVLHSVDPASAVIDDHQLLTRADFCARWTGKERRHQLTDPKQWLLALFNTPLRLLFAAAIASLGLVAFPLGCRKCATASSLSGSLPLAPLGASFYALLTLAPPHPLVFLAASGAHLAFVSVLWQKQIVCYPSLTIAACAWAATDWLRPAIDGQLLLLPVAALAAWGALTLAIQHSKAKETQALAGLLATLDAEPTPPVTRLVFYRRQNCPVCLYSESAIQPGLADNFGDTLEIDYRDAASLPIAVPYFFVNGRRKTTVAGVATDELYATLSAAIEAAHSPAM